MAYAPGDPNTPSHLRTAANGWEGSKYIGPKPSASAAPAVTGSQGKKPGEWIGSQYIGPPQSAAPLPPSPSPISLPQNQGQAGHITNGGTKPMGSPVSAPQVQPRPADPVAAAPRGSPIPLTREQYDQLTPELRAQYFAGKVDASGRPIGAGPVGPAAGQPMVPAGTPARTSGFDQAKLDNPALARPDSHKYIGGRFLAAGGSLDAMLALPEFKGWTKVSEDKIRNPISGAIIDVYKDFSGQGTGEVQWTRMGGTGSAADIAAGRAAKGKTPPPPAGQPTTDIDRAFREQLLNILNGSKGEVSINDPHIASQSAAYRQSRERGAQQERAQSAERAAFMGLNSGGQGSGAFESDIQGIREGAGEDIAANDANLVGQEVQARRQQLMQGLELANAVGARTEALALQRALAELDNTYRYATLGQQQGQFEDRTAFDYAALEAEMNRQALLAGLG